MVNLFPREVQRVFNLFPRELIESPPQDFPQANPLPHLRPDPSPKPLALSLPSEIPLGAFNQLPREQIENSRYFPREQINHSY